jgi:hypothetical protein
MLQARIEELDARRLVFWAATLSIGGGLVHALATGEHLAEWWGYGVFFIFAALAQICCGLIYFIQPWRYDETGGNRSDEEAAPYGRPWFLAGIAGNSAIILLFLITRTVGIPFFGPGAGQAEPLTLLGVLSVIIETGIVACLTLAVRSLNPKSTKLARGHGD